LNTAVLYVSTDPLCTLANTAEKRGGLFSYNIF
jgi:hypothetical protein